MVIWGPWNLKGQGWGTTASRQTALLEASPLKPGLLKPTGYRSHKCFFHWVSGNQSPCKSKKMKLCGSGRWLQIQTVQPRGPSLRGNSMKLSGN